MVAVLPLDLKAATVRRRGRHIIGPVTLQVKAGPPTIVLGPNGAGKTTLLQLFHGLVRASSGQVSWAVDMPQADLAQAYVFQTPTLMRRSVQDNIAYPLIVRGVARRAARRQASEAAQSVGLGAHLEAPAHVLSGGERQKLSIARAMITEPQVLFLDEPTTNLDGRSVREIEEMLMAAVARGTKVVMATHDLGQARRLAGDVIFIYNKGIHEHGPASGFLDAPVTPEAAAFLNGDILE
ncbi:ATP-binding cassette domain-containing protein [Actibacterium sp. 188UL27-1]|uniref:ATP-binding cassette domain-containing protein n=1 Tax=Actibacterium sp. 188UL27-1 TaxID=2786961 RepID=UPI00195EA78F|nr:ATP-binding cassette domain-containing protein [Actibacterium sp. 188UL27-1]MBM7068000.1 ATP-binding cassette domain-containing protein [Actibacterium sp. 188UL27-1]